MRNITGITEQHASGGPSYPYAYAYDPLDRLVSASYPTALGLPASESFAYDAAGNREDPSNSSAYDYDANHRITASPGKSWVYDADGSPVSVNAGQGSEETFAHDAQSRLRGYTSVATAVTASYLYDPFARRLRKTVDGSTTWFLWDGDQLLAEFDGSGVRDRRYTYAGGFAPAEQVIRGAGTEVVQPVHADHLETPRALSDAAGEAVWRGAHRAFGTTTTDQDPDGDLAQVRSSIRFPGQFEDPESGLHDNVNRSYDPTIGRYISSDPIGQLHGYARLNPLTHIDPAGLSATVSAPATFPMALWGALSCGYAAAERAREEANTQGLPGQARDNTPWNAFLHCWWMCDTLKRCGVSAALLAGYGHDFWDAEEVPYIENPVASTKDLVNNAYGRECGRSCDGDCTECCRAGLRAGRLSY